MLEIKAVVFDWAGTVIDFGSFAPMGAFVDTFSSFGVDVTIADARRPMGLPKRDHIAQMLAEPHIAGRWEDAHGSRPGEDAVTRVYERFVSRNIDVVADYCELVPGAAETFGWLTRRGIKVGSTTGYTRAIMEKVLPRAAEQGFTPENCVCADDLAIGRPTPMGLYRCFLDLGVWPAGAVVKVDDTEPGIAEGANAGCITVGVALSGNESGLSYEAFEALGDGERAAIRERVGAKLKAAGADHIIDTVADLPTLLERL
ncbi:phosphonoacetaldehyde hydrolase [Fulvimarina sp. 2208YS6-2-32]|uniref:Phosphonoacetaldehyde hydrolase n=1 Tax=Fulvimarina uroteuthidis TaxID=3098149 RepID=A0ABU5I3E6_9HYPH|nr:phosphonoacetaldehyde hydrolase [Fulvimarina sp. 2208YS6-2-32]MDY8109906.1 phosphonoacetaldehyde hydrolase [Fulvimarina sp. 2208YS6-2-32]